MTTTDHRVISSALRALPGVVDANVDPDGADGPGMLRLRLAVGADRAAVVASAGRLLREQFGLGVHADRVQIVAGPADDEPSVVPSQRRAEQPAGPSHSLISVGLDVTTHVTLAWGDRLAVGTAGGAASPADVHRTVAVATLRAVEQLADGRVRLDLEHVEVTTVGAERTVVVTATVLSGGRAERLTGAAVVSADMKQTVIDAVLDALDRRFEAMLGVS